MAEVVIDVSVSAAWLLADEQSEYANAVLELAGLSIDPVAPSLWHYEMRNVLLTAFRRGRIKSSELLDALQYLDELAFQCFDPLSFEALTQLAMEYNLTVYDAAYLDLARQRRVPLATLDQSLIRAAEQCGVRLFKVQ